MNFDKESKSEEEKKMGGGVGVGEGWGGISLESSSGHQNIDPKLCMPDIGILAPRVLKIYC